MPTCALAIVSRRGDAVVAMSALSELLSRANREKWSYQRITDTMRDRGHDVSKDTVWKYMSGRHTVVRNEVLAAFVDVFPSLRLERLQKAAKVAPELGDWHPPAEARALSSKEREAVEVIIRSMARGHAGEDGQVLAFPDPEDYDEQAASRSPEPAGHQQPDSP